MQHLAVLALAGFALVVSGCSQKLDLDTDISLANDDASVSIDRVHQVSAEGSIFSSEMHPAPGASGYVNHGLTADTKHDNFIVVDLSRNGAVFRTEVFYLDETLLQSGGSNGEWINPNVVVDNRDAVDLQVLHYPARFKADENPEFSFTQIRVKTSPYVAIE